MRRCAPARGFSLIELLIVVAIILVIAAIAVPNFLKARSQANETSAVGSLRAIHSAATSYNTTYSNGYPPSLDELGPPDAGDPVGCDRADLIDSVLAKGIKSGYFLTYTPGDAITPAGANCSNAGVTDYTVNADPGKDGAARGKVGYRSFFVNEGGLIHYNYQTAAGPNDPVIPAG